MPMIKSKGKHLICMICKRRKRYKHGAFFCRKCSTKGIFIKIKAFKESKEYKEGRVTGMRQRGGRLPRR